MITFGEFKGQPVVTLKNKPEDPYGFTFGLTKAGLILAHLDDIRKFYEENKGTRSTPTAERSTPKAS